MYWFRYYKILHRLLFQQLNLFHKLRRHLEGEPLPQMLDNGEQALWSLPSSVGGGLVAVRREGTKAATKEAPAIYGLVVFAKRAAEGRRVGLARSLSRVQQRGALHRVTRARRDVRRVAQALERVPRAIRRRRGMFGMFGIGGGVVVTPSLCLLTDMPYACVLGTTLTSMVPPSIVSGLTHARLGNVVSAAALPLCAGSATGAFVGGQLAVRVDEEPLQLLFAVLIGAMGAQKLWSLRGK